MDNITRLHHGHGAATARSYLEFSASGYHGLKKFCKTHQLPWTENEVLRISLSDHEFEEMKAAVAILQEMGKSASMVSNNWGRLALQKIFPTQIDGMPSASIDGASILAKLEQSAKFMVVNGRVEQLLTTPYGVEAKVEGKLWQAELAIVACHLNARHLVPNLNESLVTYADQFVHFTASDTPEALKAGRLIIAGHGHYWLSCGLNNNYVMGGARFMRKWAGIDASEATCEERISIHLKDRFRDWFDVKEIKTISQRGYLECRPCDELPIIGPMYGGDRILIGTGYMGSGFALGFAAGTALADLVAVGSAPGLPRIFWPERLRSLTST